MDIEKLSNSQLLLLTLLVSFVTSTASGVLTVSLLEETPQTVTQTVNRVVERTIERVEQAENGGAAVVTRETTVVVKEEDVLGDSVQKHLGRIAALHSATTTTQAIGSGIILPGEGLLATATQAVRGVEKILVKIGNSVYPAKIVFESDNGVALIAPELPEGKTLPQVDYEVLTEGIRLGQSVSALSGRGAVLTGIISLVNGSVIETNLEQSRLPYGATLISTLGDIIGMHVREGEGTRASFITGAAILDALKAYQSSGVVTEEGNATI